MLAQRLRTLFIGLLVIGSQALNAQTVLYAGDVAVIGVNANNQCGVWPSQSDEFSFVFFKPIVFGTTVDITDCGYERLNPGQWGDTEGVFRITRTGATLVAGNVVTVNVNGATGAITCSPGWTVTVTGFVTGAGGHPNTFDLNSTGGDQIIFCQGGTWVNPLGAENMTYSGTVLYGFSTVAPPNDWVAFANSTQRSNLPPGLQCFSMAPTTASNWTKYVPVEYPGLLVPRTQRQWILDIDDPMRWTNYPNCTAYNTLDNTAPAPYSPMWVGASITVAAGGFVNGRWTGAVSTDWFNCKNWDDAEVPIASTPVLINPLYATNNCVVGVNVSPPTAVCSSILVQSAGAARTLTVQNGGTLQVGGGITVTNTGSVSAFNGVVLGNGATNGNLTAGALTLTGNGAFKAGFRSEQPGSTASFAGNITINGGGELDLQGVGTGGTISLTGNFINNDAATAFQEANSTVIFNGNGPQSINTNAFTENFGGITLNKSSGDLTLNAPVVMSGALTLNSGRVMTSDPGGLLTLTSTATTSGANDAAPSFVHGPMVKVGTTPFTFPVGKGSDLREASISNVSGGATDAFIAEYFPADPHVAVGSPIESPPLDHISYCEYWRIDRRVGMPNARISLTWETPASCGVTAPADLRVTWWNGLQWLDRGNDGAWTGNAIAGTLTQADAQQIAFAPGGYWTLGSVSSDNPLPVELLWFDARPEGRMVRLDWATATERNNEHFTIERSADGDLFTELMRVPGAGNSTSMLSYTELDPHPLPGLSFYRLRQTDLDGTSAVSAIVPVRMAGNGAAGLVVLTGADAVVGLHDMAAGSAVDVLDMTGRAVWQGRTEVDGRAEVPTAYLGAGAYVLRVSDGTRALSAPFVR